MCRPHVVLFGHKKKVLTHTHSKSPPKNNAKFCGQIKRQQNLRVFLLSRNKALPFLVSFCLLPFSNFHSKYTPTCSPLSLPFKTSAYLLHHSNTHSLFSLFSLFFLYTLPTRNNTSNSTLSLLRHSHTTLTPLSHTKHSHHSLTHIHNG